jgi:hypothetical protein
MSKSYSKIRHIKESNAKLEGRLINEQPTTKFDPLYKPTYVGGTEGKRGPGPGGVEEKTKSYTVKMDGSLFKNGEDKIDTNSDAFKKGLTAISNAVAQSAMGGNPASIQIIGGASAVGQKQGYDNKGLAQRRANNFEAIVKTRFPNVNFTTGQPVVGTATEKNSSEANAEQFVKLVVSGSKTDLNMIPSRDKTAVNLNIGPDKRKEMVSVEKRWIVCFELSDSDYQKVKDKKSVISAKQKI